MKYVGNKRKICEPSTKLAIVIDSLAEQNELITQTYTASSEDDQEEIHRKLISWRRKERN